MPLSPRPRRASSLRMPQARSSVITQYTQEVAKAIGATIAPVKFVRFERGEGIEKRQENLADEIAKMSK